MPPQPRGLRKQRPACPSAAIIGRPFLWALKAEMFRSHRFKMQTPLEQGAPQVLPSGEVRSVAGREREEEGSGEGRPGRAPREEVGGEGPAHDGFVTLVQDEPSDRPWSAHLSVCREKRKPVLTPTLNEETPPHFGKGLHPCAGPRCASFPPQHTHTHEKRSQPHRR